jgi:hypothetical protein
MVDGGTKQRIVRHPDPRAFWAEAIDDRVPQLS